MFRSVPGCSGVFRGCSGVFRGVPWCSGVFRSVPGCSGVFRCSGVPVFRCSGVPGFSTCRFLSSVKKKSGDQHEPTALRGIIASVERYLKNLSYSQSIIEGQRSTVESFERHLFKRFSQFRDETVDQFVCAGL